MRTHGWDDEGPNVQTRAKQIPMDPDCIPHLYKECGPSEGTLEHAELAQKQGFSYRTVLGELLYAYIVCRPDIGYAITTLSKFSSSPAPVHYARLKDVARYLRRTSAWGIKFKKLKPDPSMPPCPDKTQDLPEDQPPFPTSVRMDRLSCFVDAAHANDLRSRRSTTGYAVLLCGGAVSYRTKTQSITATSSTEAEFLAAVFAAKHVKHLRAIMLELGFPQDDPTIMYEDNMSALKMINARVPTERSRHIDIQHFAIQDWKDQGDIVMEHIPGVINPADDLTKALGWVLHSRHARRVMGHYG
jgi:hypothetical protein